jgi:anti-sigma factor RsiW
VNCRDVTSLLSAERDGPLDAAAREALEQHVAACPACRRVRADLAEAAEAWRAGTTGATQPDPAGEWRTLRAQIRAAAPGGFASPDVRMRGRASRRFSPWLLASAALPFGAAAVWLAVLALRPVAPFSEENAVRIAAIAAPSPVVPLPARADYVEIPADASPVVFLDQESGWLIVWAEAPAARTSG